jgi:hypothetical protein
VEIPTIEKPESKIPSKCPLMKDCEKEITPDGYRYTCCTRSWITCSGASEEAKKYKAKPRDWALVSELEV